MKSTLGPVLIRTSLALACLVLGPHPNVGAIPDALVRHLSNRVEWLKSVRYMVERGASTFVEFGGGPVVNGLVKRIADVRLVNITDNASVTKAIDSLRSRASAVTGR